VSFFIVVSLLKLKEAELFRPLIAYSQAVMRRFQPRPAESENPLKKFPAAKLHLPGGACGRVPFGEFALTEMEAITKLFQ
jgi:hypothetical protein